LFTTDNFNILGENIYTIKNSEAMLLASTEGGLEVTRRNLA